MISITVTWAPSYSSCITLRLVFIANGLFGGGLLLSLRISTAEPLGVDQTPTTHHCQPQVVVGAVVHWVLYCVRPPNNCVMSRYLSWITVWMLLFTGCYLRFTDIRYGNILAVKNSALLQSMQRFYLISRFCMWSQNCLPQYLWWNIGFDPTSWYMKKKCWLLKSIPHFPPSDWAFCCSPNLW